MKLGIISLVAALVVAAPSVAQVGGFDAFIDRLDQNHSFDIFPDAPDWKFFRTPAYCYAVTENDRGQLMLGYDQRRDIAHVGFWNKTITNYNSVDTAQLEIVLVNIIPGQGVGEPNRDWGLVKFVVAVNAAGDRVFNAKLQGQTMLRSFSRFDRLTFFTTQGTLIQNFSMAQSAKALRRLSACRPH